MTDSRQAFEHGFVELPVGVSGRRWRFAGGAWWLETDRGWLAVPMYREHTDAYNSWCNRYLNAQAAE